MAPSDSQAVMAWFFIIAFFGLYPIAVALVFVASIAVPGAIAHRVHKARRWPNPTTEIFYAVLLSLSLGALIWSRFGAPFSWLLPPIAFVIYVLRAVRGWD